MEEGGEVGAEGLGEAEVVKCNPAVFRDIHARKAAQQVLEAIKDAVQVPGNMRATAKLRARYVSQFAAAMQEAVSRL